MPDSDPRLQYSLSTPPVHHNYTLATRLTRLGVSFEESIFLCRIVEKMLVGNRPSPVFVWRASSALIGLKLMNSSIMLASFLKGSLCGRAYSGWNKCHVD